MAEKTTPDKKRTPKKPAKKEGLLSGFDLPSVEAPTADDGAAKRFISDRTGSRLRRAERGVRINVYLPPELDEELRVYSARTRRSMSDVVSDAIAEYLKRVQL